MYRAVAKQQQYKYIFIRRTNQLEEYFDNIYKPFMISVIERDQSDCYIVKDF